MGFCTPAPDTYGAVAMRASPAVFAFLRDWEKYVDHVYDDGGGTPTIGYGHSLQTDEQVQKYAAYRKGGKVFSKEQAEALLQSDVAWIAKAVARQLTRTVPQGVFDAVVVSAFNTGPNARSVHGATDALNGGDTGAAAAALAGGAVTSGGKEMGGLSRRRQAEAQMLLSAARAEGGARRTVSSSTPSRPSLSSSTGGSDGGGLGLIALVGVGVAAAIFVGPPRRRRKGSRAKRIA